MDVLFPISLDRGQDEAAVLMNKPAMAGGVGSHWLGIAEIFTTCPDTNVSVGECHGLEGLELVEGTRRRLYSKVVAGLGPGPRRRAEAMAEALARKAGTKKPI